nr:MAG TPA: LAMBDA REPRESSOR (TRIPLE MUTANT)/DNA COMPLEX-DNA COMPLEX, DOUBLE HELIX, TRANSCRIPTION-DNA.1A [Caudoviricetes sp.]
MLTYLTTSYTNEELGQLLNISESTVVRMLRYDKLPTKEQCLKIRRLLDERD